MQFKLCFVFSENVLIFQITHSNDIIQDSYNMYRSYTKRTVGKYNSTYDGEY